MPKPPLEDSSQDYSTIHLPSSMHQEIYRILQEDVTADKIPRILAEATPKEILEIFNWLGWKWIKAIRSADQAEFDPSDTVPARMVKYLPGIQLYETLLMALVSAKRKVSKQTE